MSDCNDAPPGYINYPKPRAHDIPYLAPPPLSNPLLKGLPLHYAANLITRLPGVPYVLYLNAGFASLRHIPQLETVETRVDPTVIPLADPKANDEPVDSYADAQRVPPKSVSGRFHTIADFHNAYKTGETTPYDIVEKLLPLISRDVTPQSPHSIAFIDINIEKVTQAAEESTRRWRANRPLSILDGVPFAVKDCIDVQGYKRYVGTTQDLSDGGAKETGWCVKKLEEAGAVMVGTNSMHEMGMDTTNNNPNWGTPLNPYHSGCYTGGSSGGGAYAVAAGLVPFVVGSDGGGSIRIPAGYCGVYGLKPTHNRVSQLPTLNANHSVTVQGPIAASMADLATAYRVLAQPDPSHALARSFAPPRPLSLSYQRKKILGIHRQWFDRADPIVQDRCTAALKHFQDSLGYRVVDIDIPLLHQGQLAHAMTIMSETAASHPSTSNLTAPNKLLLTVAKQAPATDLLSAQRLRHLLMQHLAYLWKEYPGMIIVTPTTPNAGWRIGEGELERGVFDGNMQIRNMEYVWLANFTGCPCLQLPVGYKNVDGKGDGKARVPVGMMGHAEWGKEDLLIEFGFDGEGWLNERDEEGEGRRKPEAWVDVLGM